MSRNCRAVVMFYQRKLALINVPKEDGLLKVLYTRILSRKNSKGCCLPAKSGPRRPLAATEFSIGLGTETGSLLLTQILGFGSQRGPRLKFSRCPLTNSFQPFAGETRQKTPSFLIQFMDAKGGSFVISVRMRRRSPS